MTSTNDEKEVKNYEINSLKGKAYYIELYKSLETRLSGEGDLHGRTESLSEAWRIIHQLCLHATATTHPHLITWLQRNSVHAVLQSEWQSNKAEHAVLEAALDTFIQECQSAIAVRNGTSQPWETQLLQWAEWFKSILSNPWEHPVLDDLVNHNGEKSTDEDVLRWGRAEQGVTVVARVRALAPRSKHHALRLVSALLDRVRAHHQTTPDEHLTEQPSETGEGSTSRFQAALEAEAGFTKDVWETLTDIEFVLLYKRKRSRCIELAKATPLSEGYKLAERLRNRLETSPQNEHKLWENAKNVATLVAQMLIARCMVVPWCAGGPRLALYCCARSLARLLPAARLGAETTALAALAPTSRHLHTFAAALDKECGPDMKSVVCELYIRAITAGMNELENLKLDSQKECEARCQERTLSAWFSRLGAVVGGALRAECALTAFSVHPAPPLYRALLDAPPRHTNTPSTTTTTTTTTNTTNTQDTQEKNQESVSEFGSWACDSRSQTNLVKTSETLNLKQTHKANVMSTAVLTEGEAIGLSPELSHDLAVLLSGPRLKTLSWDMDREVLLFNCRQHMERTHGGTRVLTTELKYLNLDPAKYQHLPEEDDGENDIYYGIEKGYEHLVEVQDTEIWQDPFIDPEGTESACSEYDNKEIVNYRKKKSKRRILSSDDEERDPLSFNVDTKKYEEKKERPHSKERSTGHKPRRKTKSIDRESNKSAEHSQESMKLHNSRENIDIKKEKKPRKKKNKDQSLSLSSLLDMKVVNIADSEKIMQKKRGRRRKDGIDKKNVTSNKNQDESFTSINPEENRNLFIDGLLTMNEGISPEKQLQSPLNKQHSKDLCETATSSIALSSKSNASATNLLNRTMIQNINYQTIPSASTARNISEKKLSIPDFNQYLCKGGHDDVNKKVRQTIKTLLKARSLSKSHCDSSTQSSDHNKYLNVPNSDGQQVLKTNAKSSFTTKQMTSPSVSHTQHSKTNVCLNSVLYTQPRVEPQHLEHVKQPPKPRSYSILNIPQVKQRTVSQHQQHFENFIKALPKSNFEVNQTDKSKSSGISSGITKEIRPMSRVTPVTAVKNVELQTPHCAKPTLTQNKLDNAPNTFARLSYMHKNKQTEDNLKQSTDVMTQTVMEKLAADLDKSISTYRLKKSLSSQRKNSSLLGIHNNSKFLDNTDSSYTKSSPKTAAPGTDNHSMLTCMLQKAVQIHPNMMSPKQKEIEKYKGVLNTEADQSKLIQTLSIEKNSHLSELDQHDLISLLRQKSILKAPNIKQHNIFSKPKVIPEMSKKPTVNPSVTSTSFSNQVQTKTSVCQHTLSTPTIIEPTRPVNINYHQYITSPKQTKSNIISENPHKTSKNLKVYVNKDPDSQHIPVLDHQQDMDKKQEDWESVMDKILSHKTPKRGPSALDIASQKDSHSINRNQTYLMQNVPTTTSSKIKEVQLPLNKLSRTPKNGSTKVITTDVKNTPDLNILNKNRVPQFLQSDKPNDINSLLQKKSKDYSRKSEKNLHKLPPDLPLNICKGAQLDNLKIKKTVSKENLTKILQSNNLQINAVEKSCDLRKTTEETPKVTVTNINKIYSPKILKANPNATLGSTYFDTKLKDPSKIETSVRHKKVESVIHQHNEIQPKNYTELKTLLQQDIPKREGFNELLNQSDPFISGLQNSDYDLLEELMDDDLRKEIGELSSDEETFSKDNSSIKSVKTLNSNLCKTIDFKRIQKSPDVTSSNLVKTTDFKGIQKSPDVTKYPSDKPVIPNKYQMRSNIVTPNIDGCKLTKNVNTSGTPIIANQNSMNVNVQNCNILSTTNTLMTDSNVVPQMQECETQTDKDKKYNVSSNACNQTTTNNSYITQPSSMPKVVVLGKEIVYNRRPKKQTPKRLLNSNTLDYSSKGYIAMNTASNINFYQTTQLHSPIANQVIIDNMQDTQSFKMTHPSQTKRHIVPNQLLIHQTPIETIKADQELSQVVCLQNGIHTNRNETIDMSDKSNNQDIMAEHDCSTVERRVLSQVQENQSIINVEKINSQCNKNSKHLVKNVSDNYVVNKERLQKKRLAIINREMNQRCFYPPIALDYKSLRENKSMLSLASSNISPTDMVVDKVFVENLPGHENMINPNDKTVHESFDKLKSLDNLNTDNKNLENDFKESTILLRSSHEKDDKSVLLKENESNLLLDTSNIIPIEMTVDKVQDENLLPRNVTNSNENTHINLDLDRFKRLDDETDKLIYSKKNEKINVKECRTILLRSSHKLPETTLQYKDDKKVKKAKVKLKAQKIKLKIDSRSQTKASRRVSQRNKKSIKHDNDKAILNKSLQPPNSLSVEKLNIEEEAITDVVDKKHAIEAVEIETGTLLKSNDICDKNGIVNKNITHDIYQIQPKEHFKETGIQSLTSAKDISIAEIGKLSKSTKTFINRKKEQSTESYIDKNVKKTAESCIDNDIKRSAELCHKLVDEENRQNKLLHNKANDKNTDLNTHGNVDKENIKIKEVAQNCSGNPDNKVVIVKLPNGKSYRTTVYGKVNINFNALFKDPQIKSLLNKDTEPSTSFRLNINQYSSSTNCYNKIVSTQDEKHTINHNSSISQGSEIINLLSDEEDDVDHNMATEFGHYKVTGLDFNTYNKHQQRFSQKSYVRLIKYNAIGVTKNKKSSKDRTIKTGLKLNAARMSHESILSSPINISDSNDQATSFTVKSDIKGLHTPNSGIIVTEDSNAVENCSTKNTPHIGIDGKIEDLCSTLVKNSEVKITKCFNTLESSDYNESIVKKCNEIKDTHDALLATTQVQIFEDSNTPHQYSNKITSKVRKNTSVTDISYDDVDRETKDIEDYNALDNKLFQPAPIDSNNYVTEEINDDIITKSVMNGTEGCSDYDHVSDHNTLILIQHNEIVKRDNDVSTTSGVENAKVFNTLENLTRSIISNNNEAIHKDLVSYSESIISKNPITSKNFPDQKAQILMKNNEIDMTLDVMTTPANENSEESNKIENVTKSIVSNDDENIHKEELSKSEFKVTENRITTKNKPDPNAQIYIKGDDMVKTCIEMKNTKDLNIVKNHSYEKIRNHFVSNSKAKITAHSMNSKTISDQNTQLLMKINEIEKTNIMTIPATKNAEETDILEDVTGLIDCNNYEEICKDLESYCEIKVTEDKNKEIENTLDIMTPHKDNDTENSNIIENITELIDFHNYKEINKDLVSNCEVKVTKDTNTSKYCPQQNARQLMKNEETIKTFKILRNHVVSEDSNSLENQPEKIVTNCDKLTNYDIVSNYETEATKDLITSEHCCPCYNSQMRKNDEIFVTHCDVQNETEVEKKTINSNIEDNIINLLEVEDTKHSGNLKNCLVRLVPSFEEHNDSNNIKETTNSCSIKMTPTVNKYDKIEKSTINVEENFVTQLSGSFNTLENNKIHIIHSEKAPEIINMEETFVNLDNIHKGNDNFTNERIDPKCHVEESNKTSVLKTPNEGYYIENKVKSLVNTCEKHNQNCGTDELCLENIDSLKELKTLKEINQPYQKIVNNLQSLETQIELPVFSQTNVIDDSDRSCQSSDVEIIFENKITEPDANSNPLNLIRKGEKDLNIITKPSYSIPENDFNVQINEHKQYTSEVIEIGDSSNDSVHVLNASPVIDFKPDTNIDFQILKLRNLLLQELSEKVSEHRTTTKKNDKKLKECVVNITKCDNILEKYEIIKNTKRSCFVKLYRCDISINKMMSDEDNKCDDVPLLTEYTNKTNNYKIPENTHDPINLDVEDISRSSTPKLKRSGSFSILNDFAIYEAERNSSSTHDDFDISSPVIDVFDVIASVQTRAEHSILNLQNDQPSASCYSEGFLTKRELHKFFVKIKEDNETFKNREHGIETSHSSSNMCIVSSLLERKAITDVKFTQENCVPSLITIMTEYLKNNPIIYQLQYPSSSIRSLKRKLKLDGGNPINEKIFKSHHNTNLVMADIESSTSMNAEFDKNCFILEASTSTSEDKTEVLTRKNHIRNAECMRQLQDDTELKNITSRNFGKLNNLETDIECVIRNKKSEAKTNKLMVPKNFSLERVIISNQVETDENGYIQHDEHSYGIQKYDTNSTEVSITESNNKIPIENCLKPSACSNLVTNRSDSIKLQNMHIESSQCDLRLNCLSNEPIKNYTFLTNNLDQETNIICRKKTTENVLKSKSPSLTSLKDYIFESNEVLQDSVEPIYKDDFGNVYNENENNDPVLGAFYVVPVVENSDKNDSDVLGDIEGDIDQQIQVNTKIEDVHDDMHLNITIPTMTYRNKLKRKKRMRNWGSSEKKYRKAKQIDSKLIKNSNEICYRQQYQNLLNYCSSVKFSFSLSFHKEHVEVQELLKNWPITNDCTNICENSNVEIHLFKDFRDIEGLSCDYTQQTLSEEIATKFEEVSSDNVKEKKLDMGFGEGSDRVITNLEDYCVSKFSAATLSDVKQTQPFPTSENCNINIFTTNVEDHIEKIKNYITFVHLRDKVRSFFRKTSLELSYNLMKDNGKYKFTSRKLDPLNFPFELCATDYIVPAPIEAIAQIVQVGQLPVSAAAQNPVTCDPRVTQVSDASPSQFSAENSPNNESPSTIKTEYTELTTADLTLSLVSEYEHHNQSMMPESQVAKNISVADKNIPIETEIKNEDIDIAKEEDMSNKVEDTTEGNNQLQLVTNDSINNVAYTYDRNVDCCIENDQNIDIFNTTDQNDSINFNQDKQRNGSIEKTDQIAHAMNAAGITTSSENINNSRAQALVNLLSQKIRQGAITTQTSANNFTKTSSINAMAIQQALAQILPPPLNQTNATENGQQTSNTSSVAPQVLHIVQGKNSGNQITLVDNTQQSVMSTPNATQVLHIVQNKSGASGHVSSGSSMPQTNSFGGLSLVDTGLQQGGSQLLHIVNTGNQKNNNTGQLIKRVNLLTNLTNVQGPNEQKMVQFVCKSADGKAIQLNSPHQRSMVLRLQPIETPSVQNNQLKSTETQEISPPANSTNLNNLKETTNPQQEIKSRSVYEENYAKFIQNSSNKQPVLEKSTSLPKFNQAFGKQVYQDGNQKQNEMSNNNSQIQPVNSNESTECQSAENAINIEHLGQISSPPLLLRKSPAQTSQPQSNLVQQAKPTIAPMNIQTMHGGVIYTRQIPVNIGGGQTINLITVPSTELVDETANQKPSDMKFINQNEIEPSIIKIVPQNQSPPNTETSEGNNNVGVTNENSQTQPVLTQMRIKLPMLSKNPQMVPGTRVMRPSFFQIQRNVIGGANQPVYQQLVLTAAPPLGQQLRIPQTRARPIKVPNESQSESQMSSSTLEQLREFDMVLEQVKERSTVQPNGNSSTTFPNLPTQSNDSPDGTVNASTESTQQVLYSIGNNQSSLNVAYVNRKSTVTPTTSTFVRSPDSSGVADSPSSSTHAQIPHTITSETVGDVPTQPKPAKVGAKSKSRPKSSSNPTNSMKISSVPPKTSSQKPLEDEQTTQRILYILAEYKEQVENSPDKDKPAPRRRSNPPSNPSGSSKRKKSSSSSRRSGGRDMSPIHGDDTCRTMGSEDSSCGTSQGDCNESCIDSHSPQDSPRKVVRKLTFENETPVTQPRPQPQRNVIVADGQTITVARGSTGKPTTAVLMPANYILPVSMMKGGQQIAIVTNRGPKLLTVGGTDGGATNALLLQRLIGPAGLKPVLTRPGVRHVRLPTAALHNLQAFNLTTATATPQPPDSTVSPALVPTPDLMDTRATSSPWAERESQEVKPERSSSPEGSEPWNLQAAADPRDYTYEEPRNDMDRTVLDSIQDRYSPDMEAQRIFDKMFDVDSKKSYIVDSHDDSPRCGYDIDASDCEDKGYHQVVHKRDGSSHRHHRLAHVSTAALRHKYAILEHELRLQKSLSEECEDLGVDSPSASELFPEAELLFAASPAHEQHEHGQHPHTPQPTIVSQSTIPQPDMDDQIATDQLLQEEFQERQDLELGLGLGVGIVVSEGQTTALDHEEFARSHPNTTFHTEPTDEGEVPPFTISSSSMKSRHITSTIFHSSNAPATVLMTTPQTTVISQAIAEPAGAHGAVKYADIDNMINSLPGPHNHDINLSSVLVKDDGLTRFDSILNDSRELHLSNTASAIVHSGGNATQVIRRVCYEEKRQGDRFLSGEPDVPVGDDAKTGEDSSTAGVSSPELFWESNSASEPFENRRALDSSSGSDSDKCCKSPEESTSGSSGRLRLRSVIQEASSLRERRGASDADGSSAEEAHEAQRPLRTYPPQRHASVSGKTRAGEPPGGAGERRRASARGVVKRGCHCCGGDPPPLRNKKPRQRKLNMDFS